MILEEIKKSLLQLYSHLLKVVYSGPLSERSDIINARGHSPRPNLQASSIPLIACSSKAVTTFGLTYENFLYEFTAVMDVKKWKEVSIGL